ncbi:MAG: hypothetical protein COV74_03755 [Candidatus Omnitrophica bacterium CG11_big_fil_rev_8_21_14_0_20_45_26]|uniref:Uncharacterized protein n=1 Tax=Candidatus Abzuiibacterium crystallinum TaxID=1974748 RepID=A0A2H0LQH5_9BACT|nr:MAG: hypothetical protein COV74_03755 [Candidatus Omnitrophica bacterium CG11_big_fil_rev_8_21_14_0_20_45_26]PIW64378.1 MAG: hypothetical protein COW12_06380 [Candidatus Omnitrophica bacterium CG12_big_fil_rev_8_21_14_0_65_45_16]
MKSDFPHMTFWVVIIAIVLSLPSIGRAKDLLDDNPYLKTTNDHMKQGGYFKKDSAYIKSTSKTPYFNSKSPYMKKKSPYFQKRPVTAEGSNVFVRGYKKLTSFFTS